MLLAWAKLFESAATTTAMRWTILCMVLLFAAPAFAYGPMVARGMSPGTYSPVDPRVLPLVNVYDPREGGNVAIASLSAEELDMLLGNNRFVYWNDVGRVCESYAIMFGHPSPRCMRSVSRAYVSFEILPRWCGWHGCMIYG